MTEPYDRARWDRESESSESVDLEAARENVFDGWPSSEDVSSFVAQASTREPEPRSEPTRVPFSTALEPEEEEAAATALDAGAAEHVDHVVEEPVTPEPEPEHEQEPEQEPEPVALLDPAQASQEHAPGDL